jgi:predicted metal-dependent enzyme (double-stranded beta helix superfamily)
MASGNGSDTYTVRQFAHDILDGFNRAGSDTAKRLREIEKPMQRLAARKDLVDSKYSQRSANHIEESRVLFFDGELWVTFDRMLKGRPAPVHDHGNDRGNFLWEAMVVHTGRLKHTVYEREDDRSQPGYAKLKVIDDRVLEPGDVVIVGPPAEIHSFDAVTDEVKFITVVDGHYPPERQYFKPEENKAILTTPKHVAAGAMK